MIVVEVEKQTIPITLDVEEYIGTICPEEINTYEGDYTVIPKIKEQNMHTKNKMMKENVTINQIPVHEFSNETGKTVVIGGIL